MNIIFRCSDINNTNMVAIYTSVMEAILAPLSVRSCNFVWESYSSSTFVGVTVLQNVKQQRDEICI
jgi:hypothetical protein